ncbi:Fic family protein [Rhodococcus qingshengii]
MTEILEPNGIYKPFPAFTEWGLESFDTADFTRYAELLSVAKKSSTPENLEAAMTAAKRYAAVDTGAIEGLYAVDRGFTRTIATQAAAWEAVMESRGAHVRPAFDDALSGYEYVLDAATQTVGITELWIKELHEIICASQETYTVFTVTGPQEHPLPKDRYKEMPNSPTLADGRVHAYAPVIDTVPEMQRLINELRSESFLSAHPVVQAAYAHYAYVCIHPFADGNGRLARALSSVYLYRSPGVPFIVFADQRNEYYDALEAADSGDPFPFVHFVMTRTIDAIGIIRSMLTRSGPSIAATVAGLNKLFDSGAQDPELQAAAVRLRNLAAAEAMKQLQELSLPSQLTVLANPGHVRQVPPPPGYGVVGDDGSWYMDARSTWPHEIRLWAFIAVFVKVKGSAASEILMASRPDDGLEVWMRELEPVESETLKLKLAGWVEGKIAELLDEVTKKAQAGGSS